MPYNHKQANAERFPVKLKGKVFKLTEDQINVLIKEHMKSNKAIMSMFDDFDISPDYLDNLKIRITDLPDRYAETDEDEMRLDKNLFNEDADFIEKRFFICAHEILHWLTRVHESRSYFADDEERTGFMLSIAYEMSVGTPMDVIYNRIYPKISFHFHNEEDSAIFFQSLVHKAKKFLRSC